MTKKKCIRKQTEIESTKNTRIPAAKTTSHMFCRLTCALEKHVVVSSAASIKAQGHGYSVATAIAMPLNRKIV